MHLMVIDYVNVCHSTSVLSSVHVCDWIFSPTVQPTGFKGVCLPQWISQGNTDSTLSEMEASFIMLESVQ